MNRKPHRAAVIAAAATMSFMIFGTDGSGAYAQDSTVTMLPAQAESGPADAGEPRFVAEEVVQPLADEAAPAAARSRSLSLGELVSGMPADGNLSSDMRCLAEAIYFEARGEPLAGQLAVGRVVVNRAESDAFPDDYCAVVKQPAQFSFVKGGRIPAVDTRSQAWQRAVAIARIAHQELWDSPARDALYFHATRVHPRWARTKLARATIERHVFYR